MQILKRRNNIYFTNIKKLKQELEDKEITHRDKLLYTSVWIIGYVVILGYAIIAQFNTISYLPFYIDYLPIIGMVFIVVVGTYYLYQANGGVKGEGFLERYFSTLFVVSIRLLPLYLLILFVVMNEDTENGITVSSGAFIHILVIYIFAIYYCSYGHLLEVNNHVDNRAWIFDSTISKKLLMGSVVLGAVLVQFTDREFGIFVNHYNIFLFTIFLSMSLIFSNQKTSRLGTLILFGLVVIGYYMDIGSSASAVVAMDDNGESYSLFIAYQLISESLIVVIGALVLGIFIKHFYGKLSTALTIILGTTIGFILFFSRYIFLEIFFSLNMLIFLFWMVGVVELLIEKRKFYE